MLRVYGVRPWEVDRFTGGELEQVKRDFDMVQKRDAERQALEVMARGT